jgi:hypothetical protein
MKRLVVLLALVYCSSFVGICCAQETIEFEGSNAMRIRKKRTNNLPEDEPQKIVALKGEVTELTPAVELQIMQILKKEPSLIYVQEQALKYAGIPSHKEFRHYRVEARARNILPSFSYNLDTNRQRASDYDYKNGLSFVRPNDGAASNVTYNHNDSEWGNAISQSGYRTHGLGAGADWNLQKLIYDDEITDILSEQRRFATIRNDLMDQVNTAYNERRRKLVNYLINPPKTGLERIMQLLEIQELTSKLDSLTGGAYSKNLKHQNLN